MDADRISIARLLAIGLPLTWQETVAVCRAAAVVNDVDSAMNDRPPLVSTDACFITRGGEVELPETADHESPEAVAHLLREMLEGREAPEALRALVRSHRTRDLLTALADFPLADPRAQIGALAARALDQHTRVAEGPVMALAPAATPSVRPATRSRPPALVVVSPSVHDEVPQVAPPFPRAGVTALGAVKESLRLRLKSAASPAAQAIFAERLRQAAVLARSTAALFGVIALLTLVTVTWWVRRGAAPTREVEAQHVSSGSSGLIVIPRFSASAVQQAPDRRRASVSQVVAPAHNSGAAVATPLDVPKYGGVTSPLVALSADIGKGTAADGAPSTMAPPAALNLPVARGVLSAPAPRAFGEASAVQPPMMQQADDSATVFTAENGDVAPPTLRRQQLPLAVPTPGVDVPEGWPYLVLVVGPAGDVETVRLNVTTAAPGRSLYRHRMLVAAAKAWQFAPARKNGKPVRYAIRVALEP